MKKTIFFRKWKSSKTSKVVYALICDLGYTRKYLTFDYNLIAEILGLSVESLINLDDTEFPVGAISLDKEI